MKGYGQFCPVAQTLEIVGERWTLLVVRELLSGSQRFNDLLRGVPLMSRTLLSQRLKSLQDAGIVERRARGKVTEYSLTQAGEELRPLVEHCGVWGRRWARRDPDSEQLDAGLLMWDMRRHINHAALPPKQTVTEFRFRGAARGMERFWLVLEPNDVDLCLTNPGFGVDLVVSCHLRTMTQVWMGDVALDRAIRSGAIELEGARALQRAFESWLALSHFASVELPKRDTRRRTS